MVDEINDRVAFVKHCTETIRRECYKKGRDDMREVVVNIIKPLLVRDATLQKLLKTVEELE